MKRSLAFIAALIAATPAFAQDVEMADTMRSNGKIYVVVAVLCTVFIVLAVYIYSIDRRVTRMEKENK